KSGNYGSRNAAAYLAAPIGAFWPGSANTNLCGGTMRKFVSPLVALILVLGVVSAHATTVVIPDPDPQPFIFFGNGDASVTYDNVMFTQQLALGDANLFNVGHLFSGLPAVLSSQEATVGVENILITLPTPTTSFSIDYGTFFGSGVTFLLGN